MILDRKRTISSFLFLSGLFFLMGCANYNLNYFQEEENWAAQTSYNEEEVAYTLYLLGDAGESPEGKIKPAIKYFNKMLGEAPANSAAILLGDNIYFKGMPKKDAPDRAESEHDLNVQLDGLQPENFKGKPIIIMGNHDWGQDDPIKGVKRQEKYIHKYLNTDDQVVFPEGGCGGPEAIELTDNLVVIAIDSKWWIYDWSKLDEVNDGCDINSREEFLVYFEDLITDYKGKNIVIALHHPPFSNGPHGGYFHWESHIFPLRQFNKSLWIPMPVIGTVVNATRASVGTDTDISNPKYKTLKEGMIDIVSKHDSVLFVSGHEHTLQYFEIEDQRYIVSGSGVKQSPAKAGSGALFATAKEGFSIVKVMEDGTMWTEFYVAHADGNDGDMVYRKQMKGALPQIVEDIKEKEEGKKENSLPMAKTTIASVYPEDMNRNLDNDFMGNFNADLFFKKIEVPNLNLTTHLGGLEILQQGGSAQTNSLRLKSASGEVYVLRSLRKDPVRGLPDELNFALADQLMKHFFTGSNPFAALALPPMAEAIGISHANPKLYYLPTQEALGRYNEDYAEQLYMLEERPDETWQGYKDFGDFKDFVSYRKIFKEIKREDDKAVLVDQEEALRNRLFDLLIGDFDRHLDNWRFGLAESQDTFLYVPIPRDRDVAFSNWDGVPYTIGKFLDPFLRATHNYDDEIGMMKWLVFQGRGFDDYFLNQLTWPEWKRLAEEVQMKLTDDAIDRGLALFPSEVRAQVSQDIKPALQARRRDLVKYARRYYEFLNKYPEVLGTDNQDYFRIERLENGDTRVQGWTMLKKDRKVPIFDRVFTYDVTKEIRIFGLDKDDKFEVVGEAKKGIKVRLIGGYEEDVFIDESKVGGFGKKTIVNDEYGKNEYKGNGETKDRRSDIPQLNQFRYLKQTIGYNYSVPIFLPGYNPDEQFILGLGLKYFHFPYQRQNVHEFNLKYAFATQGLVASYEGLLDQPFDDKNDIYIKALYSSPLFTFNYFGLGNNTDLPDLPRDFNRIRLSKFELKPTLRRSFFEDNYFEYGPTFDAINIENTPDRITAIPNSDIRPSSFDWQYFAGLQANLKFDFVDNGLNPENGIKFSLGGSWKTNLKKISDNFANFNTSLSFYQGWGEPRRLVYAGRVGYKQIIGDFDFFQANVLGSNTGLRGYRQDRFAGESTFFLNNDFRLRLFHAENFVIPFTMGLTAGADLGRVWLDGENSSRWHAGYGGGLWIAPVDLIILNFSYFVSEEDQRFVVRLGHAF